MFANLKILDGDLESRELEADSNWKFSLKNLNRLIPRQVNHSDPFLNFESNELFLLAAIYSVTVSEENKRLHRKQLE